ncbi:MAG TPA: alpha/beta hydrolase [Burkholderiales bacterium]|nr:alpha/beta hydrolase [Burkholderiales bacterium]
MRTQFNADDGERLYVYVAGEGPPVVMLHGWTASHLEWSTILHTLSESHRVYRWDARGHGGHPLARDTPPTVERMARDLENLLDHCRLDAITAVGHSMGALTLWEYIRGHGTGRLARACFIDQSPRLVTDHDWRLGIYGNFDREQSRRFIAELRQDFAEAVLRLSAHGLNGRARQKYEENARGWRKSRDALRALDPAPLIATWESLTAADYRDVLERIDVPTLLVFGAQSNFYRLETAEYLRDRIRGSELRVYEGTDHSPHQWQRERFARELLEFMDGGAR